jgi:3-methylfumaryl-CoA hydratase
VDLAALVADWTPEPLETSGRIDAWPLAAFAGLLDQPFTGDLVPPGWHEFCLLEHSTQAELDDDGHLREGRFLPPMPDRRRMFAGGRVEWHAPLRVGDEVRKHAELAACTPKTGRSGEMVFVTVRNTWSTGGTVALVEELDYVYRSQPAGQQRGTVPVEDGVAEPQGEWTARLEPDPALLFRYSALTYNAHRIHYDQPYVTQVEGYPGLVVHGPLQALLLLELPRRFAPDATPATFAYRLRAPSFAGRTLVAAGGPGGELVGASSGCAPSITGTVTFLAEPDAG